jgi:aryl-alcohol dehydrogenase-like predicted oxidoreductase
MGNDAYLSPRSATDKPALVVGCMNFGKRTPEPEARRVVDRAIERGLAFFDTANAYGDGESERILGRAIAGRRDRVRVATKVGWWRREGKLEGLRPERMRVAIDESLERLGTDHVDLWYLHVPDHETPLEATLEGVRDVLAAKKALAWGVSNFASWQVLELFHLCDAGGVARPVVSQQMYNLLVRQLDVEYWKFTRRHPIHTTVYNPLAGGLLSGRHKQDGSTLSGSRFAGNPLYQRRYLTEPFFRGVEAFEAIAKDHHLSLVELAYAWVATRPGVDSILVGPGSVAHLDAAIDALAKNLDAPTLERIDDVHRTLAGTDATYAR